MTACHCNSRRRRAGRRRPALIGLLAGFLVALVSAGMTASPAWADGDPASDVLAGAPLFLSGDAGFSGAQQAQLTRALARLQAEGLAVRVAVIASPGDLGSVAQLWQMPGAYARFLGEELSLIDRGTLLVVMPDGIGVARIAPSGVTLEPVAVHPPVRGLAAATFAALTSLVRASGHRLDLGGLGGRGGASAGGGWALGSIDLGSIIALVVGAVILAAAWRGSLRARPWGGA
jgi:hypothetical protein